MRSVDAPAIWTYWETQPGMKKPPYLDACETTIRRQAGALPVRVLDAESILCWIEELPTWWGEMSVVQRSDYVRTHVVAARGGIWVDADTIALRPLEELLRPLDRGFSFVGYGDDGVHNGLFAGLPGCPLLGEWAALQEKVLHATSNLAELEWNALGSQLVTKLVDRYDWHRIDHHRIAPVAWRDWELFLSRTYPAERVLGHQPITIALYNAQLSRPLAKTSVDELINGRTLIGRLLRLGLGLRPRPSSHIVERFAPIGDLARRLRRRQAYRSRRTPT